MYICLIRFKIVVAFCACCVYVLFVAVLFSCFFVVITSLRVCPPRRYLFSCSVIVFRLLVFVVVFCMIVLVIDLCVVVVVFV